MQVSTMVGSQHTVSTMAPKQCNPCRYVDSLYDPLWGTVTDREVYREQNLVGIAFKSLAPVHLSAGMHW